MLAAVYPAASETFVWREAQALREHGVDVTTVGLRPAASPADGVPPADLLVYGPACRSTFGSFIAELATRPLRTIATCIQGCRDAIIPAEPTSLRQRLKLVAQVAAAVGIARQMRRRSVEHIHCHFAHAPTTVGMYAARQLGIRFSFTGHANDLFQRRTLLRLKLRRAAGIACISEWHAAWYRSIEPGCADRCRLIRCGVDIPDPPATAILEQREVRLISVGRLVRKKGFDILLRAFGELFDSEPTRWRLTIVGDGPEGDSLRALASELRCEAAVRFTGALPHSAVREMLREADLFVMPCRTDKSGDRDGIPVAMMEAMAAGRLVVAGDLPAIRELVRDAQTGYLVSAEPRDVADRLTAIANEPQATRKIAQGGRGHVRDAFATDVNVRRLLQMIDPDIGDSSPPGTETETPTIESAVTR